jgi:hypothetical protein
METNVTSVHSLSNKKNLGLKAEEYVTLAFAGVGITSSRILL